MVMKQKYSMDDLLDIVKQLRHPQHGCPWDKEQTHESIRQNFIEETYEVADAIDLKDEHLLCEELGDVLLQVALHTQMEHETGAFCFEDVTTGICKKLITRHPHIFGDVTADTSSAVLKNWEEIKRSEKKRTAPADDIDSVPASLPALMYSQKIQKRAANHGFCYENVSGAIKDLDSEIDELKQAIESGEKDEAMRELGDVLFSCVNVARFLKCDAELALSTSTKKFIQRFKMTQELAAKEGVDLNNCSAQKLDELYKQAKALVNKGEKI